MATNAQKNKFLIDGFPRNQDNLQGWNKTMDGEADVAFVLFFDCNNEVRKQRWSTVREIQSDFLNYIYIFYWQPYFFELGHWVVRTALSFCWNVKHYLTSSSWT